MLIRAAAPVLAALSLQTGETAALAVLRGGELVYVEESAPESIVAATWKNRAVSLHATSTGKALLAFLDPRERDRLLERAGPLVAHTPTTIVDPEALAAELTRTRERGYGCCAGEFEVTAYGVSAPVLGGSGEVLALVSLWGPGDRLTPERFEPLGRLVASAAASIAG